MSAINGNGNLVLLNHSSYWASLALENSAAVSNNTATPLSIDSGSGVQISVSGGSWWVAMQGGYIGGDATPSGSVQGSGLLSVTQVAVPFMAE